MRRDDGSDNSNNKKLREIRELAELNKGLVTTDMKTAVRKAGRTARKEIQTNAPKKTGAYSKS